MYCRRYSQEGEKDFRLVSKVGMNSYVKMNPFYESEVFLVLDVVVGIRTDTLQEKSWFLGCFLVLPAASSYEYQKMGLLKNGT